MVRLAPRAALLAGLSWGSIASAQVIFAPVVTPPLEQPVLALPGEPLSEWIDPDLGSTAAFARGCGHTAEVHLSSRPGSNFATVVLRNDTGRTTQVTDKTRAVFGRGVERWLEQRSGQSVIPSKHWAISSYAFPDKEDFAGQSEIRIVLALAQGEQQCELTALLKRQPGMADSARSVVEYAAINFHIGAGVGLNHSAGADKLPQHPGTFLLGVGSYPWVRHGMHFHLWMEFAGNGSARAFVPEVPDATLFTGMLSMGYGYQRYLFGPLNFGYRGGPGAAVLEASRRGDDAGPLATEYAWGLAQSVHLDLDLAPSQGLGLAAYHLYVPSAELSGVPVSGHRLGLLLTLYAGG